MLDWNEVSECRFTAGLVEQSCVPKLPKEGEFPPVCLRLTEHPVTPPLDASSPVWVGHWLFTCFGGFSLRISQISSRVSWVVSEPFETTSPLKSSRFNSNMGGGNRLLLKVPVIEHGTDWVAPFPSLYSPQMPSSTAPWPEVLLNGRRKPAIPISSAITVLRFIFLPSIRIESTAISWVNTGCRSSRVR